MKYTIILFILFVHSVSFSQVPTFSTTNASLIVSPSVISNYTFTIGDKLLVTSDGGGICGLGRWQEYIDTNGNTIECIAMAIFGYTSESWWLPSNGENLYYHIYDTLCNTFHQTSNLMFDTSYMYNNGNYYHDYDIYVVDTIIVNVQKINIPNGWSMISTYINPYDDLETVMSYIDLIIMKDYNGNSYIPYFNFNQIGTFTLTKGYQIKVNSASILSIKGVPQLYDSTFIPTGWSMFGLTTFMDVNIDSVFYNTSTIIIKDGNGNFWWKYYNVNTIGLLQPGQGYQIKTNNNFIQLIK